MDEGVSERHSARASKEAELGVSSEGVTPPKLQSLRYKSGIRRKDVEVGEPVVPR